MRPLAAAELATVTGGWLYGSRNQTGERWASAVDAVHKRVYDTARSPADKNALGVVMLLTMGPSEWVARRAGWVWEHTHG